MVELLEADLFSIVYGCISFIFLVVILIISLKQSIGGNKKGNVKWYKRFWNLKSILLPSIDHIADTISDIALIIEFYYQSRRETEENDSILDYNSSKPNIIVFFIVSIIILLIYRTKSAIVVYRITHNLVRSILQFFFDLELYRAIYINVKFSPSESLALFKYVRQDECFYESIPQSLLALIYMIYSGGNNHIVVYVSLFLSLKSFSDRYITYDGLMYVDEANHFQIHLKSFKKCSLLCADIKKSFPFIIRCVFRFCDIVSRLLVLSFIWTVMGYLIFILFMMVEMFAWWFWLAIIRTNTMVREWIFLFYFALLVHPWGVPATKEQNAIYDIIPRVQILRSVLQLIVLYLFIFISDIHCDSTQMLCPQSQHRYDLVMDTFNLNLFIICNVFLVVAILLYPVTKKNLVENQVKVTTTIATDIWYPARAGNVTDLLANLAYGSSVNTVDKRKRSALHYAASRGHTDAIKVLLAHKEELNVNLKDNREWTALHFCVRYAYKNCFNVEGLNAILQESHNLDINLQTNKGETALILASKPPFPDEVNLKCVAKLLIEKSKEYDLGMDVNRRDNDGNDALYYWSLVGDDEMVKLLLDEGATYVNTNKEGKNALDVAKANNNDDVVKILIDGASTK